MVCSRYSLIGLLLIFSLVAWINWGEWIFKSETAPTTNRNSTEQPHHLSDRNHNLSVRFNEDKVLDQTAIDPKIHNWLRRDVNGLKIEEHADGRRSLHLEGRFSHVMRLQRMSSGVVLPHCVSSVEAWEKNPETPMASTANLPSYER